jgi:hypothetical protein
MDGASAALAVGHCEAATVEAYKPKLRILWKPVGRTC